MMRNILVAALMIAVLSLVAGCGGGGGSNGGGGGGGSFVLSGTVKAVPYAPSVGGAVPVEGARVTIAGRTATTNSDGYWSLGFSERPMAQTFSVNATTATSADPSCYSSWAAFDGNIYQSTSALVMPLAPNGGMDLGTIYLSMDNAGPPPPPFKPSVN